jgi:hypothetical protein
MRELLKKWLGITADVAEIMRACNSNFLKIEGWQKGSDARYANLEAENKYLNMKLQMLENGMISK